MKRLLSVLVFFVFMVSFVFAGSNSSTARVDFYIPEKPLEENSFSMDYIFWGVGIFIVVLIVVLSCIHLGKSRKTKTVRKTGSKSKKHKR